MCGITGFCDFSKTLKEDILVPMCSAISHRGPDATGKALYQNEHAHIGFGHTRLSILDLSEQGTQPMERDHLKIVFNGEIYNFKEIKEALISLGHTFSTTTDTEVILAAYKAWGMACLNKFVGMFAFALYDAHLDKMFLVRDRVGTKPLYVYQKGETLIFGSELKSFHQNPKFEKVLDNNALALYLKFSYIPTPYCIFKDTQKVKPGHYIEVNLKRKTLSEKKYWDVIEVYNQPKSDISYPEAVDELEKILKKAFNYRMVADVPVGVFLSGGYDSAAVAGIIQSQQQAPLKTFTIGFEEKEFDEGGDARKIAQEIGSQHTELTCTAKEATDIFHSIPEVYDEPFADNSVVPTILVCKLAKEQVKVALSGDGGDEIFAGYNKFQQALDFTKKYPNMLQSLLGNSMAMFNPDNIPYLRNTHNFSARYEKMINIWQSHSPFVALKNISYYITEEEAENLLAVPFQSVPTYFDIQKQLDDSNDDLNKMLAIDYRTFLMDNNMVKIDRASMSVGLEGREPFLDQNIIEFAATLPSHYKIRSGYNKSLLKHVTHRYIDPAIMDRPKKPFIAPLKVWFKDEMKNLMMEHIQLEILRKQGIFNPENVIRLRDRYLNNQGVSHQKIWNILLFQLWYKKYMA